MSVCDVGVLMMMTRACNVDACCSVRVCGVGEGGVLVLHGSTMNVTCCNVRTSRAREVKLAQSLLRQITWNFEQTITNL